MLLGCERLSDSCSAFNDWCFEIARSAYVFVFLGHVALCCIQEHGKADKSLIKRQDKLNKQTLIRQIGANFWRLAQQLNPKKLFKETLPNLF